ncbi:DMT family transporter [Domibacillus sp. DTU_2020_1001157_1_SI_ALB_TIR_016]|uniref:DMT family transporter n=1 Tax=Domibacillus sp. DTU_2020_1001157_1_SI_ALB_TIR_016 TaxID=3077789 RepID=UPI003977CD96
MICDPSHPFFIHFFSSRTKQERINRMKKGILLLIIATLLWAGNYICGRYLGPALPATLLNTIRWAISTLILWGLLALNKKQLPLIAKWKEFFILGFLGIFAFSTLNYIGLKSISASQAGMISAGIPIAILFFTPFFLKDLSWAKPPSFYLVWPGACILFSAKNTESRSTR